MTELTIVMYHYVRPLAEGRFQLAGLDVALFEEQIDYLARHYHIASGAEVVAALRGETELPDRSVLLTFDDGYKDHYVHAFRIMRERGLPGVFFVPSAPVLERSILNVNKIHFVLAATDRPDLLADQIDREVEQMAAAEGLRSIAEYRAEFKVPNRFDPPETNYVKRMLQLALPAHVSGAIADRLFRTIVTQDTIGFAEELYLSTGDAREMLDGGMEIGTHTHSHPWLSALSAGEQRNEITNSLNLLDAIGVPRDGFLFAYPYGGYSAETVDLLAALGCALAVTTEVRKARMPGDRALTLPRLDTNDMPKSRSAPPPG